MRSRYRNTLTELAWLTASCVLTMLLAILLFGQRVFNFSFDYHLHDTYIVLSNLKVLIPLFLFITFFIYFIKEFANKFTRRIANWILVTSGILSLFVLNEVVRLLSIVTFDLRINKALSSLNETEASQNRENPFVQNIVSFLSGMQVMILLMLLFTAYCWGAYKRRSLIQKD